MSMYITVNSFQVTCSHCTRASFTSVLSTVANSSHRCLFISDLMPSNCHKKYINFITLDHDKTSIIIVKSQKKLTAVYFPVFEVNFLRTRIDRYEKTHELLKGGVSEIFICQLILIEIKIRINFLLILMP